MSTNLRALPFDQVIELERFARLDAPSPGGTLACSPLGYHGLIRSSSRNGMPLWTITARGRAWLAANNAARAARAATVDRLSGPQLTALRIVAADSPAFFPDRTAEALYVRGLIDWTDSARRRWTATAAGLALLARLEAAGR